jgi:membrane protease YdiL (CAAX protease family)
MNRSYLTGATAVAIFASVTMILSFAVYLLPVTRAALPFLIVLVPAVVASALTAMSEGLAGVRALWGKLEQWRISPKWLAIALLLALVMRLAMSVLALLLGLIPALQVRAASPAELLVLAAILIVAAIPEELGWRGYVLPKLLPYASPLMAGLIIGVLWGSLHLVLLLPGMAYEGTAPLAMVLQLVGLSVLITWLYVNSGGNVLLTTFFHAAQSFFVIFNEGITAGQQMWLMAGIYLSLALIITLFARPQLMHPAKANHAINPAVRLSADDTTPG